MTQEEKERYVELLLERYTYYDEVPDECWVGWERDTLKMEDESLTDAEISEIIKEYYNQL